MLRSLPWTVPMLPSIRTWSTEAPTTPMSSAVRTPSSSEWKTSCTPFVASSGLGFLDRASSPISSKACSVLAAAASMFSMNALGSVSSALANAAAADSSLNT